MEDKLLNFRITYDDYEVLSVRILSGIIFVKTKSKTYGTIIWFLGFDNKRDLNGEIKRILMEGNKYTNSYFKAMFKDDSIPPEAPIMFNETEFGKRGRRITWDTKK